MSLNVDGGGVGVGGLGGRGCARRKRNTGPHHSKTTITTMNATTCTAQTTAAHTAPHSSTWSEVLLFGLCYDGSVSWG